CSVGRAVEARPRFPGYRIGSPNVIRRLHSIPLVAGRPADSMGESRSEPGETDGDADAGAPAATGSSDNVVLLERGTAVGRYVVLERLGAGAMGVVHAAYDPELDRKVAIKLLRSREAGGDGTRRRARLQREAQAIAR